MVVATLLGREKKKPLL